MSINDKIVFESWISCEQEDRITESIVNQPVKKKIHITAKKYEILKAMLICFKAGGINGIENGSINELAEILTDIFSFDYQGNHQTKSTSKDSIRRSLSECEQKTNEEKL